MATEMMAVCSADPEAFRAYFLRLCAADIEAATFAPEDGSDPEEVRTAAMIALGDFMGAPPSPSPITEERPDESTPPRRARGPADRRGTC